jgi:hypothetical protein
MSQRAKELAEGFTAFNNDLITFVENCSDENWQKVCPGENWSVGVVARHIAAGHYGAIGLAKLIVAGEKLPELTNDAIDQGNVQHAQKHAGCTRDEVLDLLRENGASISGYVAGLSDADLDRTGHLALTGGDMSTEQFVQGIIIQSGGAHVKNMKAATGV